MFCVVVYVRVRVGTSGGEFFTISTRGCKFFTRCRFRTGFMNTVHCTVPAYSTAYSTVLHLRTLRDIMENSTLWKTHLRSGAAFGGCVRGLRSVRTTAGTQVQRVCLPPACIRSCSGQKLCSSDLPQRVGRGLADSEVCSPGGPSIRPPRPTVATHVSDDSRDFETLNAKPAARVSLQAPPGAYLAVGPDISGFQH